MSTADVSPEHPFGSPQRDQLAARLRLYYEGENSVVVYLDRREVDALVDSDASAAEVHAWLRAQIDRAEAERTALAELEEQFKD